MEKSSSVVQAVWSALLDPAPNVIKVSLSTKVMAFVFLAFVAVKFAVKLIPIYVNFASKELI